MGRLRFEWLGHDLRSAARALRRTPGVTIAAIATLALGIGATATIFSIFQAVFLRELPVAAPRELYFLAHGASDSLSTSSHYPWLEHLRRQTSSIGRVAAYNVRDFKVESPAGIERVAGQYATGNYHAVAGVPFQLGRGFSDENDRTASAIAVISDAYWSRRFARRSDVIGQPLTVGGHQVTIVGVTSPGFHGMNPGQSIDVTLPLSLRIQDDPEFPSRIDTWTSMPLVVRVNPDVPPDQATSAIASIHAEYMAQPDHVRYSRMSDGQPRRATLLPAGQGADRLRRTYETPLTALMRMVALVLVLVCVNVANLLLMKAPVRAREVALRMALGASRRRIVRQLLTESALLAACGGAIGLLLASWATRFVSMLLSTGMRPIVIDLQPDAGVVLFAAAVSIATAMAFGVAPAWRTAQIDLARGLRVASDWIVRRGRWGQHALVALQIAVCLVLLFGAGLLTRSLYKLRADETGFRKRAVVLLELDARDTPFPADRVAPLCTDLVTRLRSRRDVAAATCSTMSPIATNSEGKPVLVPGAVPRPDRAPIAYVNSVDEGYFTTFGVEILRGRAISPDDRANSERVAVVSESLAHYYFGDANPIGRVFSFGRTPPWPPITVVGVARDARQYLRDAPPHMAYTPLRQRDEPSADALVAVWTSGDPAAVLSSARDEVRALTRDVSISYVRTMDQQISAALVTERLLVVLSVSFAVLALALACIGLYGVMSYEVTRRVREIGIRIALGATRAHVIGRNVRYASLVTLAGIAIGLPIAILVSGILSDVLFGLTARDLSTLIGAAGVVVVTALITGYLPARRAAGVDAAITLKAE